MDDNKLKNHFDEHKDAFDSFEAPMGMFDKIAEQLDQIEEQHQEKKSSKIKRLYWPMSIAASIVLTFSFTMMLMQQPTAGEVKENLANRASSQIKEIEQYYGTKVNEKMDALNVILANNEEEKKEILMDINSIDSLYIDLKSELKENIDNEEIVAAMIQHYQVKLKMLEDLLFYLEQYESEETHEKEERHEI